MRDCGTGLLQPLVQAIQLLLQPLDVSPDARSQSPVGAAQTVFPPPAFPPPEFDGRLGSGVRGCRSPAGAGLEDGRPLQKRPGPAGPWAHRRLGRWVSELNYLRVKSWPVPAAFRVKGPSICWGSVRKSAAAMVSSFKWSEKTKIALAPRTDINVKTKFRRRPYQDFFVHNLN